MRTHKVLLSLVLVALVAGAFFVGRASVSRVAPTTTTTLRPSVTANSFNPLAVTFISTNAGWTLGIAPCSHQRTCLALRGTTDQGRTWTSISLPTSLTNDADRDLAGYAAASYGAATLNVQFANAHDGWIYGSLPGPVPKAGIDFVTYKPTLWSTHDGGRTWQQQPLLWMGAQGFIFDLEAHDGTVYLMAQNKKYGVTVESSLVGDDDWRVANTVNLSLPAGGANPTGSMVFAGSNGWLVAGNDRGVSGSARLTTNGRWIAWNPPCDSIGNSYAVPAASSLNDLVVVCQMGGFASPLSPSAPPGASLGSNWLYFSYDGGSTFSAGLELRPIKYFSYGLLASPVPGTILITRTAGEGAELLASFDSGVHWSVVYQGQFIFLGFTNATQGVAITRSSKGVNALVMTFDGGRHWTRVSI